MVISIIISFTHIHLQFSTSWTSTPLFKLSLFNLVLCHGHSAALDLAFIPMSITSSYMILPPVSNSDYQSILISVFPKSSSHPTSVPPSAKTIHLYSKANYEAINRLLESIDWSLFLFHFWSYFFIPGLSWHYQKSLQSQKIKHSIHQICLQTPL